MPDPNPSPLTCTDTGPDQQIDVVAWSDLLGLPGDLDAVAERVHDVATHARTWVCRRDGFEPSPVCLLRPLAELMDVVATAFDELERLSVDDWSRLRDGVRVATDALRDADGDTAVRLDRLRAPLVVPLVVPPVNPPVDTEAA